MQSKYLDELNATHNLLIIGNGFDLHLGLHSSFSNFFQTQYLLHDNTFDNRCNNIFAYLLYLRYYAENLPNSFLRRVYEDNPNWMDVESFIQKIATDHDLFVKIYDCLRHKDSKAYPSSFNKYSIALSLMFREKGINGNKHDYSTLDNILSDDLTDFENKFSDYIKNQLATLGNYQSDAHEFVSKIFKSIKSIDDSLGIQILNFNYTKIKSRDFSEANVHGTLFNKIVIGYDSTTKEIDDRDVYQLSKDWRKLSVPFDYQYSISELHSIIVYGHSLGVQDYPYFFEILDKCKFLKNDYIRLYLCYSQHGKNDYEKKRNFDKYQMNASKMLNAYERYCGSDKQRNTIISSLKLSKRIELIEVI